MKAGFFEKILVKVRILAVWVGMRFSFYFPFFGIKLFNYSTK